jgi:hypothetical protein
MDSRAWCVRQEVLGRTNLDHFKMVKYMGLKITQACEDFAATIIIGEMGYTKCHDSKNVNGFYVSGTDFLQFHIYVIS